MTDGSEHHRGFYNGSYHRGPRRGCYVCDRFVSRASRLTLHAVVLAEIVTALVCLGAGRHLSWPQFLAVTLLPWLVDVADRKGWLG